MARKSKANLKRAASAARTDAQLDPRQFDLAKKPIINERVSTAITNLVMTTGAQAAIIKASEIILEVHIDAGLNGETLGPRTNQMIHLQLSRLGANGYIRFLDFDLEKFAITDEFKSLIQQLADMHKEHRPTIQLLDPLGKHRVKCAFFRAKFQRNFKRQATRRELDLENRRLLFEAEKHSRVCPLLNIRAPSVASQFTELIDSAEDTARNPASGSRSVSMPMESNSDTMYMDDVLMAEGSRPTTSILRTPVRSGTLNNPEAYPSPESAARQVSAVPSTSYLTPSRSRSPTASGLSEDLSGSDDEEEIEVSLELQGTGVLFAPDMSVAPAVPTFQADLNTEGSMEALKREIRKLEKAVEEQRKNEQSKMRLRRKSWRFSQNRQNLQRRKWWKALKEFRQKFEREKTDIEGRIRDLQNRHNAELQDMQDHHGLYLEELRLRHEAEKREWQDHLKQVEQEGKNYAAFMQRFLQQGFQEGMAASQAFLSTCS